jgi:opacity protein-like surface antigen
VKRLFATALAVSALIIPLAAHAADMRRIVKAPPPPVFTWDGFYAGINAGGSVGRNDTIDSGVFTVPSVAIAAQPYAEQFKHSPAGWVAGMQAGYNAQFMSGLLLGVEADFQWTGQKDTVCMFACGSNTTGFFNLGGPGDSSQLLHTQKLDWLATARARIGFASNAWLWYVTGGAAYGRVRDDLVFTSSFIPVVPNPYPAGGSASFAYNKLGWTAGAGVETQIWGNWSAKLEYLYVDLGGTSDTLNIVSPLFGIPALPRSFAITTASHLHDHIVRAGRAARHRQDGLQGAAARLRLERHLRRHQCRRQRRPQRHHRLRRFHGAVRRDRRATLCGAIQAFAGRLGRRAAGRLQRAIRVGPAARRRSRLPVDRAEGHGLHVRLRQQHGRLLQSGGTGRRLAARSHAEARLACHRAPARRLRQQCLALVRHRRRRLWAGA